MIRSRGLERAIAAARAAAASHRHAFVGTEHLLVGLLDDPTGLASTLLSRTGMDPTQVKADLLGGLRQLPAGQAPSATGLPFSRLATQVLDAIASAAERAGEPEVTDRQLLAALLAEPRGRVAQVIKPSSAAMTALRAALRTGEVAVPSGPGAVVRERRERRREHPAGEPGPRRRARRWSLLLLLAVPTSVLLDRMHGPALAIFLTACAGMVPLAALMGEATEALAERTGPTIGGLLNATFGNAAELIIALVALRAGLVELVKASITGSILGNLLLILGLSCIAAGTGRTIVRFSRTNAGMSAAMLALAVIGLVFPALFHAMHRDPDAATELRLSEWVAGILVVTYGFSLVFSLRTHRALFGGGDRGETERRWRTGPAIALLAAATAGVVVESELLVHAVEGVTSELALSETFLGLVIIPLIGNAAEHATAVVVARKGQMDLAFQIALGSSTQIALLVAPVLVFAGLALGASMNLVFPVFEVVALAVATLLIAIITLDGETHWFEGVQLLAVYGLLAAAAYVV